MKYFSDDYLNFFKELAANNNKEWFDIHRKRYETVVREPFKIFVTDLIGELEKRDPEIQIQAKDAIFRINRDIRFSKDKTPYKLNNSAIVSKAGRKDKNYPGIYIEFSPDKLRFYGGVYVPDTKQVQKIRTAMLHKNKAFNAIISAPDFKKHFGEIQGDKNKRIPPEFREMAITQPLLLNKQWYYYAELSADVILKDDLMEQILMLDTVSVDMKTFLKNALFN